MKIYISYFAKLQNIPKDIIPVAICLSPPGSYRGLRYKPLVPPKDLFDAWNSECITEADYVRIYEKRVLNNLNAETVLRDLRKLSKRHDVVLLSWEDPQYFCYLNIAAEWLSRAGIDCSVIFADGNLLFPHPGDGLHRFGKPYLGTYLSHIS